ncbi:MAG: ribosome maturation factor RimP [Lachnospiraceae bacterium]|nr:ribosome maturation factor RimP [Lachnospiraceae bacterium]HCJ06895.1 ribosome maturation factor RimP [Lachnospiraceae bacterium]
MTKKQIETTCEELVLPIIEENGFELVDVEYVKEGSNYYLRVYADKPGGITIDDCVLVSRALNPKLDAYEKEFKDAYILEVSSPGLLRPLKKDKDFARNLGKMVEIKLFKPLADNKVKEFEAELKEFDDKNITVIMEDDQEVQIERSNLALIRLAFEF